MSLGNITVNSYLKYYDWEINYMLFTKGEELYDTYEVNLNGLSLTMTNNMRDYWGWMKQEQHIKVMKDVSINFKLNQCLEPNHQAFPTIEAFIEVKQIDIFFSDWVMRAVNSIKDAYMPMIDDM